jgi:hypothetical protein
MRGGDEVTVEERNQEKMGDLFILQVRIFEKKRITVITSKP